jgi:hypothetical protein
MKGYLVSSSAACFHGPYSEAPAMIGAQAMRR